MGDNLTQTYLDFQSSPAPTVEILFDLVCAALVIVGFVSNVLNAVVWRHQKTRSTFLYFIAISVSNSLFCLFYFLKYSLDTFGFLNKDLEAGLCNIQYDDLRYFVFHPLKEVFNAVTIWLSVGLAAERFVLVWKPLKFTSIITKSRTVCGIVLLSFGAAIINLPLFFEYERDAHGDAVSSGAGNASNASDASASWGHSCRKPEKSAVRKSRVYIWLYRVALENLLKFFLPFLLMTVFNVGIIRALKASHQFRRSFQGRASKSKVEVEGQRQRNGRQPPEKEVMLEMEEMKKTRHQRGERDSSNRISSGQKANRPLIRRNEDKKLCVLCICYISIMLVFILPSVTRRGLFALRSLKDLKWLDTDALDYFRWASYLLDAIKPSTDFILYIVISRKFRSTFLRLIRIPLKLLLKDV